MKELVDKEKLIEELLRIVNEKEWMLKELDEWLQGRQALIKSKNARIAYAKVRDKIKSLSLEAIVQAAKSHPKGGLK